MAGQAPEKGAFLSGGDAGNGRHGNGPAMARRAPWGGRSGGRAMEGTGEGREARDGPRIHYARHCHNDRGAGSGREYPYHHYPSS